MRRWTTHALYRSKLWQQEHCRHPQKFKSWRFNACGNSSTHRTNLWRWWSRRTTARKTRTKQFIEKVRAIIDENPLRPIRQIARDLGVSHTTLNACLKEDLKWRSYRLQTSQILTEKIKNLRLIKSIRPPPPRPEPTRLLCLVIRRKHHQHDPPTKPKPAWSPPSAEYSPSSRRRWWKNNAPSSGSVSRQWLRLKASTLNWCQLYYIIKLPELIFFNKSFKIKL